MGTVVRRLGSAGKGPGKDNYVMIPPKGLVTPAVQPGTNPAPVRTP